MRNVHIGLVTVLYNSNDVLEDFFRSLSIQNFNEFTLYLVDNSYTKDSLELINVLLEKYDLTNRSIYINSGSNVGIAEGNNIGIRKCLEANLDYILLLNNDICFENPDLLKEMIHKTISNNFKIIVPKIYYFNSKKIWFISGIINFYRVGAIHLHDQVEDVDQFNDLTETDYAPTCFMLINKEVFDKIGLMDAQYFVYMDDVDFVYRARLLGYKINVLPKLIVEHKVGYSTGGSESEFSFKFSLRNRIYFARKFLSTRVKTIGLLYLFSAYLLKAIWYKRVSIYFEAIKKGMKLDV